MAKFNGQYKANALTRNVSDNHVTIAEVKQNLQFDDKDAAHADDDQIKTLIGAAVDEAEGYTGAVIAYTKFVHHAFNFSGQSLAFNLAPFVKISKIEVSTDNGETFTTITEYHYLNSYLGFEIWLNSSISVDEIKITFYAGYSPGTLPDGIRKAIIQKASDGYDTERSDYSYQVTSNKSFKSSLNPFVKTRY